MKPEKRQERRTRIIRAARGVFLRYGYRKTALEDVARAATVGKATLYHYFDGKDDLFGAVVNEMYEEYLTRQRSAIVEVSAAADKLRRYAQLLITEHQDLVVSAQGFEHGDDEFPDRIHAHLRRLRASEVDILEGILRCGVESGEFRRMNTGRVALLLLGSLRAMLTAVITQPEAGDGVVSEVLQILFCGLLTNSNGKELS